MRKQRSMFQTKEQDITSERSNEIGKTWQFILSSKGEILTLLNHNYGHNGLSASAVMGTVLSTLLCNLVKPHDFPVIYALFPFSSYRS